MREAIFEGKTEEETLLKASSELGVNISDMKYEVLEVETGLFGLFGKSVKIRVRVQDEASSFVYRKGVEPELGPACDAAPAIHHELPVKGPAALDALRGVLTRMDVEAEVKLTETDESVLLNIETQDHDSVIGRDGEVLAALQFIVNKMINRFPEDRKLIVLDAEGFRDRREVELGEMARGLADKAVAAHKVVRLSPMSAQDRRLVHMALKGRTGLTTRSEGEGNFRCLLIVPDGVKERPRDRGGRGGPEGGRGPRRDWDRGRNA